MKLAWNQVVIAFVLGGCVGAAVGVSRAPRWWARGMTNGRFEQQLLNRLSSKLQLTAEQRQQVAGILDAKRKKMDALRADIRPRFEELRASTSAEIRRTLTPSQQQTFDAMQKDWEAKRQHARERWGPAPSS